MMNQLFQKDKNTSVREHPLSLNSAMVQAVLDGRKTQTRLIVKMTDFGKPAPGPCNHTQRVFESDGKFYQQDCFIPPCALPILGPRHEISCPYGIPGDRLWVRETWCELRVGHFNELGLPRDLLVTRYDDPRRNGAAYRANCSAEGEEIRASYGYRWKHSIHMPRWASRLTLEIVNVRVERLHDLSEADALDEGCDINLLPDGAGEGGEFTCPTEWFMNLWNTKYGSKAWDDNPWVWVIDFKRTEDE